MGIEPFKGRAVLYDGGVVFGWSRIGVEPCWGGAVKGRAAWGRTRASRLQSQMPGESREGRAVLG